MTSCGKYLVVPCVHLLMLSTTFYANSILSKKMFKAFHILCLHWSVLRWWLCPIQTAASSVMSSNLVRSYTKLIIHWSNFVFVAAGVYCSNTWMLYLISVLEQAGWSWWLEYGPCCDINLHISYVRYWYSYVDGMKIAELGHCSRLGYAKVILWVHLTITIYISVVPKFVFASPKCQKTDIEGL